MKVSIVIPHYNREKLLNDAISSVLEQTIREWELIVVDDGSDKRPVLPEDDRISLIQIEHCGMAGMVRNIGVSVSTCEWIAFLDSDDLWKKNKLDKQLKYIQNNPSIRIIHTREEWNRSGKIVSQKGQKHNRSGDIFDDALVKCIIGPSTVMIKRDLWDEVGGFNENLEIAEDYELWLRIVDKNRVGYIEEALTIKRAGNWNQLSEKYGHIEKFRIDGLSRLVLSRFFTQKNRMESARKELIRKCGIYRNGAIKRDLKEEIALIDTIISQLKTQ